MTPGSSTLLAIPFVGAGAFVSASEAVGGNLLPASLAGLVIIALVVPMWKRMMAREDRAEARQEEQVRKRDELLQGVVTAQRETTAALVDLSRQMLDLSRLITAALGALHKPNA